PGWFTIRIQPGDTLWQIAREHHTTIAELVALNHLPGNGDLIYAGALLRIPTGAPAEPCRARRAVGTETVDLRYRVVLGDSLDAIAARFHVDWRMIARLNHLPRSLVVILGSTLEIPRLVRVPGSEATGDAPAVSRSTVRAMLVSIARTYDVDPALVLAISWQESGFSMRVISAAGAVGAMQVMPATGRFVARYLVHRPLDLRNARDNITAGVALLSVLLRAAPVDQAVAGYYQGLGSVRSDGMFPDTRRYVADVLALRARFAGA
ncbi:MAG TPA: LysM peptidoglycan-binding domain-containing protein, partial [Mycobacteriales bacterium]|nr:LysM peptidoglycan-binding domain-containing protein [Mycobacteriales bacterium]